MDLQEELNDHLKRGHRACVQLQGYSRKLTSVEAFVQMYEHEAKQQLKEYVEKLAACLLEFRSDMLLKLDTSKKAKFQQIKKLREDYGKQIDTFHRLSVEAEKYLSFNCSLNTETERTEVCRLIQELQLLLADKDEKALDGILHLKFTPAIASDKICCQFFGNVESTPGVCGPDVVERQECTTPAHATQATDTAHTDAGLSGEQANTSLTGIELIQLLQNQEEQYDGLNTTNIPLVSGQSQPGLGQLQSNMTLPLSIVGQQPLFYPNFSPVLSLPPGLAYTPYPLDPLFGYGVSAAAQFVPQSTSQITQPAPAPAAAAQFVPQSTSQITQPAPAAGTPVHVDHTEVVRTGSIEQMQERSTEFNIRQKTASTTSAESWDDEIDNNVIDQCTTDNRDGLYLNKRQQLSESNVLVNPDNKHHGSNIFKDRMENDYIREQLMDKSVDQQLIETAEQVTETVNRTRRSHSLRASPVRLPKVVTRNSQEVKQSMMDKNMHNKKGFDRNIGTILNTKELMENVSATGEALSEATIEIKCKTVSTVNKGINPLKLMDFYVPEHSKSTITDTDGQATDTDGQATDADRQATDRLASDRQAIDADRQAIPKQPITTDYDKDYPVCEYEDENNNMSKPVYHIGDEDLVHEVQKSVSEPSGSSRRSVDAVTQTTDSPGAESVEPNLVGSFLCTLSGGLRFPIGVTMDNEGRVIVTDTGNDLVKIFDTDGRLVMRLGRRLRPPIRRPSAVVVNDKNEIFVKDRDHIYKFDDMGNILTHIGMHRLFRPFGLDFTPSKDLITLDGDPRQPALVHFSQDGRRCRSYLYTPLINAGPRSKCRFIAVSGQCVIVSDLGLSQIYLTNLEGGYIGTFGGFGAGPDHFIEPSGLAVDNHCNVYIADSRNNRIKVYRDKTCYYGTVQLDWSVERPSGIHLTHDNKLIVVNYLQQKVAIYQLRKA